MNKANLATEPDAKIFEHIAALKAAWSRFEDEDDVPEDVLGEHLEKNFNRPERALRKMRPVTLAGVLAKLEFFAWDAEVSGSDEPFDRGIRAAIADLKALTLTNRA